MAEFKSAKVTRGEAAIKRYGQCIELIPRDEHFHNISVGLYLKDQVYTVVTFSQKSEVDNRIQQIRDKMISLGELTAVRDTVNQLKFACGQLHIRPLKFLMSQSVGKVRQYDKPKGDMSIKDSKTELILNISGKGNSDKWVYQVFGEGNAPNIVLRLKMIMAGFIKYGEMTKLSDTELAFQCGQRHDGLIRILLPYSRNVSAVENMIESEAMRGQMTTNTLGFTPPS